VGKFITAADKQRLDFPDGEWIEIKPEFSQSDLDYITSRMMQTKMVADGSKKPEAQLDVFFGRQATLERGILDWSFTAEDGSAVPLTPDNISNLRTRYRTPVLAELDRLNAEAAGFAKN